MDYKGWPLGFFPPMLVSLNIIIGDYIGGVHEPRTRLLTSQDNIISK